MEKEKSNIVLDLDGVLFDFIGGVFEWTKRFQKTHLLDVSSPLDIKEWNFFQDELWSYINHNEEFWLNIPVLKDANKRIDFIPQFYLTARAIDTSITEKALQINGFPEAPVITVKRPLDKIEALKVYGDDHSILIDDHIETVRAVNQSKMDAMLYQAPYQRCCNVDDLAVISSIEEINDLARYYSIF